MIRLTAHVAEILRDMAERLDPFGKSVPEDEVLFITRLTPDVFMQLMKTAGLDTADPIPFVEMRRMRRDI